MLTMLAKSFSTIWGYMCLADFKETKFWMHVGAIPWIAWNANNKILKWMRCFNGSQGSSDINRVIWQKRDAQQTSLAVVFKTRWNLLSCEAGRPYKSQREKWLMNALMSTFAIDCCLVPRSKNSVLSSLNISQSLIFCFLNSMMQSRIAFTALASSPCTFGLERQLQLRIIGVRVHAWQLSTH